MKILENILKKFHSQKGITGTDVAVAIIIIAATVGVITGIYINIVNGSKENIRYSSATRIATQIAENIEAMSFDEAISVTKLKVDSSSEDERKIFNVSIPKGYSAEVKLSNVSSEVDVVRKFNIEVSYKVRKNYNDNIDLEVIKQRELLEQTNKPDLNLLSNYIDSSKFYYPIKLTSDGYVVTTTSDKNWYNYDDGYYANVYISNVERSIGDIVVPVNGEKYVWIPRFAKIESSQLDASNFTFLYGTSKHRIIFKNIDVSKNFYSYTLDYKDGSYNDAGAYVENTFKDNDGLKGMWYLVGGTTNDLNTETAYNALNTVLPIQN